MKLDCESENPGIAKGQKSGEARTWHEDAIDDAIAEAEGKAIDEAFADAMINLDSYGCKPDCERQFSVSFKRAKVVHKAPQNANGGKLYELVVFVDWTLDVNCKRPRHGGSAGKGRRR
jgi:hypothetical protein